MSFRVIDPQATVDILIDSGQPVTLTEPVTIQELFKNTSERFPDQIALKYKNRATRNWDSITYKEYRDRVEKIAKAFIKLGLERHRNVAVLAANDVEWFFVELATIHAG